MNYQADIVVVGAGMAGAALALAISQQTPWNLLVVSAQAADAAPASDIINSRVVALNGASVEWLNALDVWPQIAAERTCPYRKMTVWDGEGTGRVDFDAAANHATELGFIAENAHVVACLRQALEASGKVQLLQGATVAQVTLAAEDAEHTLLLSSGQRIKTSLVIAADGAESFIRKAAGIKLYERDYGHAALVATVQTTQFHQYTAYQRFSHQGPLALLPLPSLGQQHFCALVWSQQSDMAQNLSALEDAAFAQAISRASEQALGDIVAVHHRAQLPLKERHASSYSCAGVVLVGDAAHTIHPLAGQGVNLGFADAKALTTELTRAHARSLALTEPSILARYQRQRLAHNMAALKTMAAFKTLFEQQNPYVGLLRNQGMAWFNRMPWLKQQAMRIAQGHV